MNELLLIGDPVAHSISPLIHNIALKGSGMEYGLELIKPTELEGFVRNFRGIGFNVTAPHKTEIMKYLDEISDEANAIGAVNTVKSVNGRLCGYNTDAEGFFRQLESEGVEVRGKSIKIVGAGGSSRAIAYILNKNGASKITIYNRSVREGCEPLEKFTPKDCDILINTTPIGTHPNVDKMAFDIEGIESTTTVVDIIYNPRKTKLLQTAEAMGCKVYNGLKMLIFQALIAEEIWFGKKVSNEVLEEIIDAC